MYRLKRNKLFEIIDNLYQRKKRVKIIHLSNKLKIA